MDFIERVFHVSPDHGNGTFELIYVMALVFAAAFVRYRMALRRR
jgi:hypothetical protein